MSFKTLGDYAKVQGGYAYKSKDFTDTGVPVLKIKNVGKGSLLYNEVSYVDEMFLEKTADFVTKEGDILISMTGSNINQPASMVGRVARVSKDDPLSLINQRVGRLLLKKEGVVDIRFLYYCLSQYEVQYYLVSNATGSANQVNINGKLIESIQIPDYSYNKTKKIAHILSTLDDKIELNRKMNETLEAMAQALFKSWFVDFDPVHVKATCKSEQELEVVASTLGISKEILELFPSEFEESEMGMIPKGWEISNIDDEFTVTMGQSPSGKSYNETKNGMIFFQGRRDFGIYFPSERVYTTEPKRLAKEDDILLSVRAPVGDINIAMKECCIGRGLSALKHKSDSLGYSYLVLKNLRVYFDGYNTEGTVFGSVNQNTLKSLKILKDEGVVQKFNKIVEPIFKQIKNNSIEILSLQKTRDTLLPKLLSGELDVSILEAQ